MPPRSRCTLLMLCSVLMPCSVLMLCSVCACAQTTPPVQTARNLHIMRVSAEPVLDDYIDGAPPGGAMPVIGFIQRNPDDGQPATSETKAWLAYDAENLYVIFVCQSARGELRARYTKRDDIFADDFASRLTFIRAWRTYSRITFFATR